MAADETELDRYGIPITHNNEHNRHRQNAEEEEAEEEPKQPRRCSMNEEEQRERRASIKAIMNDLSLSAMERRRSIQGLMDGRRRSSCGGGVSGEAGAAPHVSPEQHTAMVPPMMPTAAPVSPDMDPEAAARQAEQTAAVALAMSTRMERNRPPCTHYQRNCTMVAPCCGLAFGCRLCHDECPVLPPPLLTEQQKSEQERSMRRYQRSSSLPSSFTGLPQQDEHHTIDRFKVTEVICRQCFTRQSSKTNNCIKCGIQFGQYHCSTCNLWMSGDENPYHCADCGFCRVGGAENFTHCKKCGMCIDAALFREHNCKIGKYMSNCPVCQEDLFSSRAASHEMPCGHAIHWHCFRDLASYDSRCPICKKTAETPERMASTWSAMAMGIALQPVPPDIAKVVDILCVDCEAQDQHRRWHFLGVQCRRCSSFNTVVERILMTGPDAATFLRENGDCGTVIPRGEGGSREAPPPIAAVLGAGAEADGQLLHYPYGLGDDDDDSEEDMEMDDDMNM